MVSSVTIPKFLKAIDKVERSKKTLHLLITLILNNGKLSLEDARSTLEIAWGYCSPSELKQLTKNLEKANLVRVIYELNDEGIETETLHLSNTTKRGLTKALEKALIKWSAERKVSNIDRGRTITDLHLFSILRRNRWEMTLEDLESELAIYYSWTTVRNHVDGLFNERIIFVDYVIDKVVTPPDVIERVEIILDKNADKINHKIKQLYKSAIERWKKELEKEEIDAMRFIMERKKTTRTELLNFLEKQGYDEINARDIVNNVISLPFIQSRLRGGKTELSIPRYGKRIVKEILPEEKISKIEKPTKKIYQKRRDFEFLADDDILDKIKEMIKSARKEIILCYYDINLPELKEYLKDAAIKRKKVTILYKNGHNFIEDLREQIYKENEKLLRYFKAKYYKNIHCKMMLKDGKEVLISSKNLTRGNMHDTGIWSCNEELVNHAYGYVKSLMPALAE